MSTIGNRFFPHFFRFFACILASVDRGSNVRACHRLSKSASVMVNNSSFDPSVPTYPVPQNGRMTGLAPIGGHSCGRILWFVASLTSALGLGSPSLGPVTASDRPSVGTKLTSVFVEDLLEAGEVPAALELIAQQDDPVEQARGLSMIHRLQLRRGDYDGSKATARMMPNRDERGRLGEVSSRDRSREGGASVADFTDLIDLITSTVSPDSWDTVGGAGSVKPYVTGVFVDPRGELRINQRESGPGLAKLAAIARVAEVQGEMSQTTPLRVVALRRLDAAVTRHLNRGDPIPETMRHLAGLRRIQRIFFDAANQEVLLAGPAGGWSILPDGRAWDPETQMPILQLDDLAVLIRALWSTPDRDQHSGHLGCSINTRDENLRKLRDFVDQSTANGPLRPGQLRNWLQQLQDRLGQQDVEVFGVPADSHVARVLVEADYRMKLIGVGRLNGGPGIPSYFDLLEEYQATDGLPLEALRWWLTMRYDAVLHSADRRAFEFVGGGVRVQSENQFVNDRGQHLPTGIAEPINRAFAENFTRHYAELSKRDLVFAELRNIFDMALALTLAREEGSLGDRATPLAALGPEGLFQPLVNTVPRVVESVVAHRVFNRTDIVVQAAGGVQINLTELVRFRNRPTSRQMASPIPEGDCWWWNVATSTSDSRANLPK